MKIQFSKIVLAAGFGLALAFTFSACDDTEEKPGKDSKSIVSKSPVSESLVYEGQTYKTVKIGKQVWMAENLNIEVGKSVCYDKKSENCNKCGKLYDWETAMKACPAGWHLPTDAEWSYLKGVIEDSSTAGTALKSKSEWEGKINGIDKYGFSALPCGLYAVEIGSLGLGLTTTFWSATEKDAKSALSMSLVSELFMIRLGENEKKATEKANALNGSPDIKKGFRSVRCVRD